MNLSSPTNATIADNQGKGTIQNDDAQPTISINDVTADEGNAGVTAFGFTVSLSNPSSETITVSRQTQQRVPPRPAPTTRRSGRRRSRSHRARRPSR